jgi:sulfide:quinone oxidoreductase
MDITRLSEDFAVCGQIGLRDIPVIAALGYRSVLCNRPDGESPDQALFAAVRVEAALAHLKAAYLPVAATGPTAADAARFEALLAELPRPILAYCRSGQRSEALWRGRS